MTYVSPVPKKRKKKKEPETKKRESKREKYFPFFPYQFIVHQNHELK